MQHELLIAARNTPKAGEVGRCRLPRRGAEPLLDTANDPHGPGVRVQWVVHGMVHVMLGVAASLQLLDQVARQRRGYFVMGYPPIVPAVQVEKPCLGVLRPQNIAGLQGQIVKPNQGKKHGMDADLVLEPWPVSFAEEDFGREVGLSGH